MIETIIQNMQYFTLGFTLFFGAYYFRNDIKQSFTKMFSQDYVEWKDFRGMLERQRMLSKM